MAAKLSKSMDPLAALSDDSDDDGEGDDQAVADDAAAEKLVLDAVRRAANTVDVEKLQSAGFKLGRHDLTLLPEHKDVGEQQWNWGRRAGDGEGGGVDTARAAAGVEETAAAALRARDAAEEQRQKRRQEARDERQAARDERVALGLAKNEKMSYNQREKRKRERGAMGGSNFVEEEKRMLRHAGSNFDG